MSDTNEMSQQKSELAVKIGSILFKQDISMGQAAKRLEIAQTDVADLLNRELDGFSIEQLEGFLQVLEG